MCNGILRRQRNYYLRNHHFYKRNFVPFKRLAYVYVFLNVDLFLTVSSFDLLCYNFKNSIL